MKMMPLLDTRGHSSEGDEASTSPSQEVLKESLRCNQIAYLVLFGWRQKFTRILYDPTGNRLEPTHRLVNGSEGDEASTSPSQEVLKESLRCNRICSCRSDGASRRKSTRRKRRDSLFKKIEKITNGHLDHILDDRNNTQIHNLWDRSDWTTSLFYDSSLANRAGPGYRRSMRSPKPPMNDRNPAVASSCSSRNKSSGTLTALATEDHERRIGGAEEVEEEPGRKDANETDEREKICGERESGDDCYYREVVNAKIGIVFMDAYRGFKDRVRLEKAKRLASSD
ncbi:hypothetical protein LguiA_017758 [Lonicera macranthoides]